MSMILYPPLLESRLKAFTADTKGTGVLTIPFQHNPAVNSGACRYMVCRLRTLAGADVADGELLYGIIDKDSQTNETIAKFTWDLSLYSQTSGKPPKEPTKAGSTLLNSNMQANIQHMFVEPKTELDIPYSSDELPFDPDTWGMLPAFEDLSANNAIELSPSSWGVADDALNNNRPNNSLRNIITASVNTPDDDKDDVTQFTNSYLLNNAKVIAKLQELGIGHYRVQIAYFDPSLLVDPSSHAIGYYSDVAIIKYTEMPQVYIEGLDANKVNVMSFRYNGVTAFTDLNDYLYSYRYIIYTDKYNTEIKDYYLEYDSGEILYNNEYNTPVNGIITCRTSFSYNKDLPKGQKYFIELIIDTVNGLTMRSPRYALKGGYAISLKLPASTKLIADADSDNAYITIRLETNEDDDAYYAGTFEILRTDHYSKFKKWDKIYDFELAGEKLTRKICDDFTIQQGVRYQYALRQKNKYGIVSNKLKSVIVAVDYEDMYLSDATHLLKIRFNPQMSTFKPNILESKLETIGNRYPYIFRNGIVNYKEFALSGLISYLMDEQHKFLAFSDSIYALLDNSPRESTSSANKPPAQFVTDKTTNNFVLTDLTGTNILFEKDFKLKVLDWLTNGKPKLLRSPTEGSYIVRLMNTSLSPQQTLGRMLHTFNSTAYEIDELTMDNLIKYNLIKTQRTDRPEPPEMLFRGYECKNQVPIMKTNVTEDHLAYEIPTVEDCLKVIKSDDNNVFINGYVTRIPQLLYKVKFYDFIPGSIVGLKFKSLDPESMNKTYYHAFMIGSTGTYEVQLNDPVMGIALLWLPPVAELVTENDGDGSIKSYYKYYARPKDKNKFKGKISFGYTDYFIDRTFDYISKVEFSDEIIQITGVPVINDTEHSQLFTLNSLPDIFDFYQMNNLACNLSYIHSLKFSRREIVNCYWIHGGNLIDGNEDSGIYQHAHLPYGYKNNEWQLESREEYFLCRTAFKYKAHDDSWQIDGKTPLRIYEIDPQMVYACHILNDDEEGTYTIKYLDGRLLRLILCSIYPTTYLEWDMLHFTSYDLGQEHWKAYDIFSIPNLSWLEKCEIKSNTSSADDSDLFQITLTANGVSDSIYFAPYAQSVTEDILTVPQEAPYIYGIPQENDMEKMSSIYRHMTVNEHTGSITIRHQEIANGFSVTIGPMVQIDAVVTVAQLTYDLSAVDESAYELQARNEIINLSQQLATNHYSLDSSYLRYTLHKEMEKYIFILSYYIAVLGIVDQPLMIPPLDWLLEMDNAIQIDGTRSLEGNWKRIDQYADDDEIGLSIWNSNILKPLPTDAVIEELSPGIYYASKSALKPTDIKDKDIITPNSDDPETRKSDDEQGRGILQISENTWNNMSSKDTWSDWDKHDKIIEETQLYKAVIPDTLMSVEENDIDITHNGDQTKTCIKHGAIIIIPPAGFNVKVRPQNYLYYNAAQTDQLYNLEKNILETAEDWESLQSKNASAIEEADKSYRVTKLVYTDELPSSYAGVKELLIKNNIISIPANTLLEIRPDTKSRYSIQALPLNAKMTYKEKFEEEEE